MPTQRAAERSTGPEASTRGQATWLVCRPICSCRTAMVASEASPTRASIRASSTAWGASSQTPWKGTP
ncbi:MAG: hypothetical protein ABI655_14955, partial [Phenylobacterium sp.]